MMRKYISILLTLGIVALTSKALVIGYDKWQQMIKPIEIHGTVVKTPKNLANFTLTDSNGNTFDDSKFAGQWSMMFFGYTRCPDICPMTLSTLSTMYKKFSSLPAAKKPKIIFVSIDPEHDTSKQAATYSMHFNNNFIGLSGTRNQINQLSKSLGVVAQKVNINKNDPDDQENYIYDHSSTIYVINPKGQLQAILTSPHKADNLATDYKALINKFG